MSRLARAAVSILDAALGPAPRRWRRVHATWWQRRAVGPRHLNLDVWLRPEGRWRWALRVSTGHDDINVGGIRHFGSRDRAMQVGEERAA